MAFVIAPFMDKLLQDLRYGFRSFMRQPAFTITAVLALALGTGANTAVFSVVYAVLLKPMPFPQPEALVYMHDTYPAVFDASVSFPKFRAIRDEARTVSALAASTPASLTLTDGGTPEQVAGARVTADYFKVFGVQPLYGRWFTAEEDLPGGPNVIMLSHALWKRRFAADPAIVGTTITVDGVLRTVVGVMPVGQSYHPAHQAWVPLAFEPDAQGGSNFLRLFGRARDGVSVEQVQQEFSAISDRFNQQNGLQRDVRVVQLYEYEVGANRRMLLILQGTVAFVLLVACANVANLLLARSVSRHRELAIRSALGAGRGRILRQVLTESVMLSAAGGLVGILLASWLMRLLLSLAPALPRIDTIAIDGRMFAFTLGVAMLTGVLFGLAPAKQAFRTDPNDSLREGGTRSATGGAKGASRTLVAVEVALALVLVVGAGLLVKSLLRLQSEPVGYRTDDIFTFNLNLPPAKYQPEAVAEFYPRLLSDLRAIPGVQHAAAINFVPSTNWGFNGPFTISGQPPFEQGKAPITEFRFVTPGYFETMGIPLLRGSDFTEAHDAKSRPVVIINASMARYFPGDNPVGAFVQLTADPQNIVREVIGVVADVRDRGLGREPIPEIFIPHAQVPFNAMGLVLHIAPGLSADAIVPTVRERIALLDPELPMVRPQILQTAVDATARQTKMVSTLTAVFALVAALLAAVGIYSLIAYSVAQRTREIGIRVALGANRRSVVAMILTEGLVLAAVGVVGGLAGSYFLTQTLQGLLYEVEPSDPVVLAGTCVGVLVVAILASVVPALRALRVDPMIALRAE